MSKFREQIAALIAEDKKKDAEPLLAALDDQLTGYDNDIKDLKKTLREKDGIKPEEFAKLEKERDELKTTLTDMEKAAKVVTKERDELSKKLTDESSAINGLLIDGGLTSALAGKVKPAHIEAVKGLLSRSFIVESDGSVRKAIAVTKGKDGIEKKLGVDEYLKEWFASDAGKEFAIDQGGTGGGAGGSGAGGANPTSKRARYEALNAKKPEELSSTEKLELVVLAGDSANTKPA